MATLRKDGRWEAKGIGSDGRRKSFYASTASEADRKAGRSYGITPDRTLYGFYAGVYVPTVLHRSVAWRSQIAWVMDKHILPTLGDRDITEITRAELQSLFNKLGRTMKASSLHRVKIVVSGIFNLAEADDVIAKNPARGVRLPTPLDPGKTALSPEELWQLISASSDRIRPFLILTGLCGLRAGEALAVTRSQIRDGVLSVTQQVLQPKGGCTITPVLKTPQSRRQIPLPKEMEAMLLGCNQVSAVFVCSDMKGGYMTPNNAARELEELIALAKVPRVTPHELRHTFISILENTLECPTGIVAALAGKVGTSVTAAYNHAAGSQKVKWMNRLWETCRDSLSDVEVFAGGSDVH